MKEKILLVGGGGHCRSCIDVLEQEGRFAIAGIIDLPEKKRQTVLGYPVVGSDEDMPGLLRSAPNVLITLGHIKSPSRRMELFRALGELGARFPVVRSPLAYVSPHAQVAGGTIVMHYAVVNAGAAVGSNCIINTRALIEHDAAVADHCHIAPGAIVNGGTNVGQGSFVGSNAVCREYIDIGENSVIGCGEKVSRSTP